MEIRWLEDFIALARTRHFSRAADEQNVTQPTFSRRIKLLEEEMKVTLVDRNTLPLSLTAEGEVFLLCAETITRQLRETKIRCLEIHEQSQSQIRFVTSQALFLSFYRDDFEPFCQEIGMKLDVNMRSSAWVGNDFINAMTANEADLLLCYWHPAIEYLKALDDENFEFISLAEELLVPCSVVSGDQRALYRLPGSISDPLPYIAYDDHASLNLALTHHLKRQHDIARLKVITSSLHSASVQALICEGYGVGWLPMKLLRNSQSRLIRAGDSHWDVPLEIRLYRRKESGNSHLQHFWTQIREVFHRI
ncbi:HTH-type transcriptional regulator YjiE [Vibrio aerogenes CECT 7868]|uniref:HTH-type transcriptional regulator YjiE n=1 Tax=Vibrio aerogenes CECT 7868 TaxID=1216006 RepID=A0A1M5YRH8_9VIBR|nr:LysR family transcriptional regulator [Vibrio aerogenes]SHI14489.1 HTH-type transcriptional regulator YjiE [Vibrio aerogenes CECT 7868]